MTRYLLLLLFVALLGARALGLELSLAPGLSVKNALLYVTAVAIAIHAAVAHNRKLELLTVIVPFGLLFLYAACTWLVVILLLDRPDYPVRLPFIRLKSVLADQILMLLVFFYGVVKLQDALWLAKALIWVVVVGNLITVVDTFNIPDLGIITTRDSDGRVEGVLGNAQEFGALMAFFLPAMVALWWVETGNRRRFALFGIALTALGVLMSASRGAVLGILGGGAMAAVYLRHWISAQTILRALVAAFSLAALALGVLIMTTFGDLVVSRMTHGIGMADTHVLSSGRTTIWANALQDMLEFPSSFLTGFGWDSYYQRAGHRLSPHSVYMDRLYNLGLIGFSLFMITYINTMAVVRRALHTSGNVGPFPIALVFGLMAWIVALAFSDIEGAAPYVWAWTGVALRLAVESTEGSPRAQSIRQGAEKTGGVRAQVGRARLGAATTRLQRKPATRPTSLTPSR